MHMHVPFLRDLMLRQGDKMLQYLLFNKTFIYAIQNTFEACCFINRTSYGLAAF